MNSVDAKRLQEALTLELSLLSREILKATGDERQQLMDQAVKLTEMIAKLKAGLFTTR